MKLKKYLFFVIIIFSWATAHTQFSLNVGANSGWIRYNSFKSSDSFISPLKARPSLALRYQWSMTDKWKPSLQVSYNRFETRFHANGIAVESRMNYLFASGFIQPYLLRSRLNRWAVHLGIIGGLWFDPKSKQAFHSAEMRSALFGESLAVEWSFAKSKRVKLWLEMNRVPSPCVSDPCSSKDVCVFSSLRISYTL